MMMRRAWFDDLELGCNDAAALEVDVAQSRWWKSCLSP
jgi:hypothetical protein